MPARLPQDPPGWPAVGRTRWPAGRLGLAELVALLWHCRDAATCPLDRDGFAEAVAEAGLVALTPVLKILLRQILQGR